MAIFLRLILFFGLSKSIKWASGAGSNLLYGYFDLLLVFLYSKTAPTINAAPIPIFGG